MFICILYCIIIFENYVKMKAKCKEPYVKSLDVIDGTFCIVSCQISATVISGLWLDIIFEILILLE